MSAHMRALLALLTVPGLTATASAQSPDDLHHQLEADAIKDGDYPWSVDRALAWTDFRGKPRLGTPTAARTSTSVTYQVGCNGSEFRYAVLASFGPAESWVRPDVPPHPVGSARTLMHERAHFDLSEIFARELRHQFAQAEGLCPDNLRGARILFDSISGASVARQTQYDEDTAHGMRLEPQAVWERWVAARLDSLDTFRVPLTMRP